MNTLGVILARAGSRGLPDKCMRALLGKPVIQYTFDHAAASRRLSATVLTTDSEGAKALARSAAIEVIDRPLELAGDTATVDAAARHAVACWEAKHDTRVDIIVLLYGNVPVRADGVIDKVVGHLMATGADSVRTVAPVSKQHPDWVHRLDGDRMTQFRPNSIYRRQDLEPLYYHDGAVAAVTREALFGALEQPDDHQAFLGRDRRAFVQRAEDAVDVDGPVDLLMAEAVLRARDHRSTSAVSHSDAIPTVTIGRHSIGLDRPVFVVAEAGVNHNGCLDTARRMVDAAADAGADAVKFQLFRAADLVTASGSTAAYQRGKCKETSQRSMLSRLELSQGAFGKIQARCDERSILFLATPFGPNEVSAVVELGARAIKIASTDLTNPLLLDAVVATGLPIILSTGASTDVEIRAAVDRVRRTGTGERLILLHCVSCYPTPVSAVNLRVIETLARRFLVPCGLSDHTTSVSVGAWAVAAGACVLEKHFTLDPTAPGPDHAMSLDPAQLAAYISSVRDVQQALGDGQPGMAECEAEVRAVATKSVVSVVDIPADTRLTSGMLTLKRPGTGIPPTDLELLIDRHAMTDIPADTTLSWDMVR